MLAHSGAGHFYTKVPVLLGVMVYALDITDLHVYKENFPADGSQVSYFNKIRWLQQFMPMEIKCIEDWSPFPTHAKNRLMVAVLALLSGHVLLQLHLTLGTVRRECYC